MNDPMEHMIETALCEAGVRYVKDGQAETYALDFFLPDLGIYLEVKRFHSDRIGVQMARVRNVIAIQGEDAVKAFCALLTSLPPPRPHVLPIPAESPSHRL